MARRRIPERSDCFYHICARSNNRRRFTLDLPTVWSIMEDYLYLLAHGFEFEIYAFVLMINHYHLIVRVRRNQLSPGILYFQRETAREMNRLSARINHVWGDRAHKSLMCSPHALMNVMKYVYRNPVRAGACARVEQYPFSTLHGLLGMSRLIVPVINEPILFGPSFNEDALTWLNRESDPELDDDVRKALRRSVFELPKDRDSRRAHPLESDFL